MNQPVSVLSMEDLCARWKKGLAADELIVDVRTAEEFAEGHVPGSRHIPYDEIGGHAEELRKFRGLYLYCRSGGRVQAACMDLISRGLANLGAVVDGGMPDWPDQVER